MKGLLLALVLVSGQAWGAVAPGTVALWTLDNVLTDSSPNGYTLSMTGTVPFVTTPTPPVGSHAAGVFGGAQYLESANARTALNGATSYTIEGYVYFSTLPATRIFSSVGGSTGDSIVLASLANGTFRFVMDDVRVHDTTAGVFTTATWYYWAVVASGTNIKMYVGLPGVTPTKVKDEADADPSFPASGSIVLGALSFSLGTLPLDNGYLDNIRFSNIARTNLPTMDGASQISPYQRNSNSNWVSPLWLLIFQSLFTKPAYALEADNRAEQARNVEGLTVSKVRIVKAKLEADIFSGKVTLTRTPTQVPKSSQSPTPTATPTATPTNTPVPKATTTLEAAQVKVK